MDRTYYVLGGKESGCESCGAQVDVFYQVKYYILPRRLVRKRHKEKERTGMYCRECYERDPQLAVTVDGNPRPIPKTPPPGKVVVTPCFVCGGKVSTRQLYGMITSTLTMLPGTLVENFLLAMVCSTCVEERVFGLPRKM